VTAAVKQIPLAQPVIGEREIELVTDVLRSGRLSLGPVTQQFEANLASYVGARYGAAVSSGTAGLHLCVRAAGIGPGDEVITSPFSFAASANCFIYEGGVPVFADIDADTLNFDPAAVCEHSYRLVLNPELAPQFGREQHPALCIHLRFRSQVRRIEGYVFRHLRIAAVGFQEFFVFPPGRHSVYLSDAAVQAGNEQSLLFQRFQVLLEGSGQFHTAPVVHPCGVHSPRRLHLHWLIWTVHQLLSQNRPDFGHNQ
jgi:hypothetical protein